MERIETLQRSGKAITGVPSGFKDLDELTSGFQPSELVIVAARPSMGKTAFCLNIAAHAAIEKQGVAVFSLEMSKESLVQRMLTAEARVDSQRVRQGTLRDADFTRLARAAGILQTYQLWIDDTPALTLLEMRSKARRLKIDNDLRLVIVDYLQLMRSPEYAENREQEISDISRGRSRPWRASSRFRSSRCRSCPARRSSAGASASRISPTSATRAPSSRTPTS